MIIKNNIKRFLICILFMPCFVLAQVDFNKTPNDDLGNIEDKFQEHFFEALKQKGIENYNRAITSLQKCLRLNESEPVVHFELGKNYMELKNFGAAVGAFKKAIALDQDNEWYLDELYGAYVALDDFDNALATVKQLVSYHPDYKQDLAVFYFENKKYKEALEILDELDSKLGVSEPRDVLRNEIYNATGAGDDRIKNLETRIANNPDNEKNYLNLIFRYSEEGNKEKAYQVAKNLLNKKPDSKLVHLALYKFYLDDNKANQAIASMKTVLKSGTIKADAKAKVLNDFVKFVRNNPQYENDLLEVTTEVANDESGKSDKELAQYYLQKNEKSKALEFFTKALDKEPGDFKIIKNVLLLQIDEKQFTEAERLSAEAIENYPSQPIFYLIHGVANNNLNRPKDAIDALEIGVDYVIDDVNMQADFYKQLSMAYKLDNNITKSEAFAKKATDVINN